MQLVQADMSFLNAHAAAVRGYSAQRELRIVSVKLTRW